MIRFSVPFSTSVVIVQVVVTRPAAASYCQETWVLRGIGVCKAMEVAEVLQSRERADHQILCFATEFER